MFPIFPHIVPGPYGMMDPHLLNRIEQLERALALTLGILREIGGKLDSNQKLAGVSEELKRLIPEDESIVRDEVAQIDQFVKQNQRPKAARLLRESTGLPWDQIHEMIRRWSQMPLNKKTRWLQIARWVNSSLNQTAEQSHDDKS